MQEVFTVDLNSRDKNKQKKLEIGNKITVSQEGKESLCNDNLKH